MIDSSAHVDEVGFERGAFGVVLAFTAQPHFSGSVESVTQRVDSRVFFSKVHATGVPYKTQSSHPSVR